MLTKQPVNINFSSGVNTKTDPFQLPAGQFSSLVNSVFQKGGLLQKRNGFGLLSNSVKTSPLTTLNNYSLSNLTTFNGNLTALGESLLAYSASTNEWVDKGTILPLDLKTLPLVRNSTNQYQADSAVASNGLVCVAYQDQTPTSLATPIFKYAILDSTTGQYIINPTALPSADSTYGTPRVFVLGSYFIILFTTHPSSYHIQYIAISTSDPTQVTAAADIATAYTPSSTINFDGLVVNNQLFIAYNTTSGGQSVELTYLTSTLRPPATPVTLSGSIATMFSIAADVTMPSNPVVYTSWYDSASSTGYVTATDQNLHVLSGFSSPVEWLSSGSVANITSQASVGILTIYYEINNTYGYDATIATNYIEQNTVASSGTVGTASVLARSVGLASKAFTIDGQYYMLSIYGGPFGQVSFEPTYFLLSQYGQVVATLASTNAGPYLKTGLPQVTITDDGIAQVTYLYKDQIQAINRTQGAANVAGIYAQLGVNLATFTFNVSTIISAEIGNNLNLSGGMITMYDGVAPVEQNFFVYPEYIEATWNGSSTVTPTGSWTAGSTSITVSSASGIVVGMTVFDTTNPTYIPSNTVITGISGTTVTLSAPTLHSGSGDALSIEGNVAAKPDGSTNADAYFYQVTYEWSDNQGNLFRSTPSVPLAVTTTGAATDGTITLNIPTLRLTYKINNPVKIVVYRWSVAQQNYYQVTSISIPTLNNTAIDYITYVDTSSDAQILGNNLIYTTGGVLEDGPPPGSSNMCLFNNRLWLIDAEDRNLLWYSKQVIENTPVEMSDLLTLYVAPTTASQGSTGPMSAIAPMDDKLIIFKKNALGYINGIGPDNTGANSQYSDFIFIASTVGCSQQLSVVFTPMGLMFQSELGIWLLGRDLSTQYVGAPVETYTQGATVLSAINVPGTTQVRFTLDSGITLMYDYYFQQWGVFKNIPALSSTVFENLHTYLNQYGQVLQETPGSYLDNASPVLMSFTTGWINVAGLQGYERFYQMYLLGVYYSPFTLQMGLAYDYNPSLIQSTTVSPSNVAGAWGSGNLWGSDPSWGGTTSGGWEGTGNVFEARIFPQRQKCESFQVSMQEVFDASAGQVAGAGLTLSGMNLIVGVKRGFRTSRAAANFG